jgi:hypothetical protein
VSDDLLREGADGRLTDLLAATEDELVGLPDDEVPSNVRPGADIKGIGIIELEALRALFLGDTASPGQDDSPLVGPESEEGPGSFAFRRTS